jgi:hypothetical protein
MDKHILKHTHILKLNILGCDNSSELVLLFMNLHAVHVHEGALAVGLLLDLVHY